MYYSPVSHLFHESRIFPVYYIVKITELLKFSSPSDLCHTVRHGDGYHVSITFQPKLKAG